MKTTYNAGKIGAIIRLTASLVRKDPSLADDFDRLRANLVHNAPELGATKTCVNCGSLMKESILHFDWLDAILLIRMGEQVRKNLAFKPFTEANKIRVSALQASVAVRNRATRSSKLGLIAQLKNKKGLRVPGYWVITRRGWEALSGEGVPDRVKVWRGSIVEYYEDKVTIADVLRERSDTTKNPPVTDEFTACHASYRSEYWESFLANRAQI